MGAILGGLNNSFVKTFHSEWNLLDESSKKQFAKMQLILSEKDNYSLYRKKLEEISLKKDAYIPNISIHLEEIKISEESFEKSFDISDKFSHIILNGKAIFCILAAHKKRYPNIERDQEMCEYLINAKFLNSSEILELECKAQEEILSDNSLSENSNLGKSSVGKTSSRSSQSEDSLSDESPKKDLRKRILLKFQKTRSDRNILYKIKEKEILKRKEFLIPDNFAKWLLWNELKALYVAEDNSFLSKFYQIRRKYFVTNVDFFFH